MSKRAGFGKAMIASPAATLIVINSVSIFISQILTEW